MKIFENGKGHHTPAVIAPNDSNSVAAGVCRKRPTNQNPLQPQKHCEKSQLPAVNCNDLLGDYRINLSYSVCVPIQNQTKPSSISTATARCLMPTLADQYLFTFFKCKDGCLGFLFSSLKFSSASC